MQGAPPTQLLVPKGIVMSSGEDRERLAALRAWRSQYDSDAAAIIEELRAAGFAVASVEDLYNKKLDYQDAISILIAWLPRVTNPSVKEDLVRALVGQLGEGHGSSGAAHHRV